MEIALLQLFYSKTNIAGGLVFGEQVRAHTKSRIIHLSNINCIDIEPKKYGAWLVVDKNREAYFARYSDIVDEAEATPFKNAVNHVLQALHEGKTD